jgi:transglutaminase-like putative cysteine protease
LAFSAQRIGIVAILVAVILPLLVPSHPRNLIADAFHKHGGGDGIGSIGASSDGTSISPFAELKGQLERDRAIPLMNVHIDAPAGVQPFYVRTNVLDTFTGGGWVASDHGPSEPVEQSSFGTLPLTSEGHTATYQAVITITGLSGNAPVFSVPRSIQGIDARTGWSAQDQLLLGTEVRTGEQFIEVVAQPQPTVAELEAAPPLSGADMSRWLTLPALPSYVTDLVSRLTAGRTTLFDKAQAIFRFFADPANRFVYSLRTTKGDSGSDLVDFLQHRSGFCQQYAAAMGVMLRAAGVPARLVLGYMHPAPDATGDFSVSTFDAHAWVEAFFPNSGWIPFDPTPAAGLIGGKKTDLPWATHVFATEGQQGPTRSITSSAATPSTRASGPTQAAGPASGSNAASYRDALVAVAVVLVLVLIGLIPAGVRYGRRRRRFARARHGDPDALWAELSDTAVDLGYVWSPARSPRQVSAWLARDAADTAPALAALATAVEERRFARDAPPHDPHALTEGLLEVTDQLWSRRSGRARARARLWPASLGWGHRLGALRRAVRRRH